MLLHCRRCANTKICIQNYFHAFSVAKSCCCELLEIVGCQITASAVSRGLKPMNFGGPGVYKRFKIVSHRQSYNLYIYGIANQDSRDLAQYILYCNDIRGAHIISGLRALKCLNLHGTDSELLGNVNGRLLNAGFIFGLRACSYIFSLFIMLM